MELTSVIDIVKSNALGCNNKFKVTDKQGNTSVRRLFVCDNGIAEYKKNSKKWGYRLYGDWNDWTAVSPVKGLSDYAMFHRNATKAAELLAASGMWPVMQKQMVALASLDASSYYELTEIYEEWRRFSPMNCAISSVITSPIGCWNQPTSITLDNSAARVRLSLYLMINTSSRFILRNLIVSLPRLRVMMNPSIPKVSHGVDLMTIVLKSVRIRTVF